MNDEKFRAEIRAEIAADIAGRKRDDGGPAFPVVSTRLEGEQGEYYPFVESSGGVTLRDYFAAAALQGMLGATNFGKPWAGAETTARLSCEYADAMLAERAK
jgi:hypothetical protein